MKAFEGSYKIHEIRKIRERGGQTWRDLLYATDLFNSFSKMMDIRMKNR